MVKAKTANSRSVVVGVFEDRQRAQQCVEELRRSGFREDQVSLVSKGQEGEVQAQGNKAITGAAAGAAVGAGAAALASLGMTFGIIPVIGPILAVGPLAAALISAAGGAAAGGLVGALVGLGIPEEEAKYYEGELHGGRTLVTVHADGRYDEAYAIIHRFGAYNYETAATRTGTATAKAEGGTTVQVREEELHARKQPVQAGEVRVHKDVVTEQKTLQVPVQREEVVVERHPVAGHQASTGDIRPGEEIRIPVKEEQVRVEKEAVVKEEVKVGKRKVQDTETVGGTVRKEEVRVEQEGDVNVRGDTKSSTPRKK